MDTKYFDLIDSQLPVPRLLCLKKKNAWRLLCGFKKNYCDSSVTYNVINFLINVLWTFVRKIHDILPGYIICVSQCSLTCLIVWPKHSRPYLLVLLVCQGLSHGCLLFLLLMLALLESSATSVFLFLLPDPLSPTPPSPLPPLLMLSHRCAGLRILTTSPYTVEDILLPKYGGTHL